MTITTFLRTPWILLTVGTVLLAQEPALVMKTYTESMEMLPNPERGFYSPRTTDDMWGLTTLWAQGHSLILVELDLKDFKTGSISTAKLTEVRNAFAAARTNGLKIIFRAAYGYTDNDYRADPTDLNIITNHINQLGTIFVENEDVLYAVQAGFLGPWGEWHGSNWGDPPSLAARRSVLFALLDTVPDSRSVQIRRPMFIRDIFATETGGSTLDSARACTTARLARTGYHDDALMSGPDDMGTYVQSGWNRSRELDWCNGQCRYTPMGGESDALADQSLPQSAVPELEKLHATYVNIDYLDSVINRWKTTFYNGENAFNLIERRLGYRFVMKQLQASSTVAPGGKLRLVMQLGNAGFSAPHCPRGIEIVLSNGTRTYRAPLQDVDPRRWDPEAGAINIDRLFRIPANIMPGAWNLYLSLPDPMPALREKSRYSIRLANTDITFSSTNGWNLLQSGLQISAAAPGETTGDTVFKAIANSSGNFRGSNGMESADITFAKNDIANSGRSLLITLSRGGEIRLDILAINGAVVKIEYLGRLQPGIHQFPLSGSTVGPGIHIIRLLADGKVISTQILTLH